MKRSIKRTVVSLFLILYFLFFIHTVFAQEPGDVNGSGVINQLDALLIKDYLLKISKLTGDAQARADSNQDGTINVADIVWINKNPSPPELAPNVIVVDSVDDLFVLDWTPPTLILQWSGSGPHGIETGDILVGSDFNGFLCVWDFERKCMVTCIRG